MSKKSTQIALGGMFSALSLVLMFMTGMIPFATYALPALAGAMLIPVMVENGRKTALMVYASVSMLSVFVVPDREAALLFIAFFGYYPVLKVTLDALHSRLGRRLLKLAIFNVTVVCAYFVAIFMLGIPNMAVDMGDFGKYSALGMLALGNIVFIIYDFALGRYVHIYIHWFKPRFLRR